MPRRARMHLRRSIARVFPHPRRLRRGGRDGILWLGLICFALTAGGVPLPDAPQIGAGGPFPCQGHRCGCSSAGQCWQNCCCFSQAEKLAWAKANGVTPPAHAVAAASAQKSGVKSQPRSCCASVKTTQSCCATSAADEKSNACDYTLGLESAKCRGAATLWLASGAVLPWTPPTEFAVERIAGDYVPFTNDAAASLLARPAIPPPRSV
jgi:hypothetical protein